MADTPMSEDELISWIGGKLGGTLNDDGNEISTIREDNYNYYYGKKYGDERENHSQFVTREVFEAIEWALPSIMRAFTSGDQVVSFAPMGPGDEGEAEQETDVVNHFIFNETNGFVVLYEGIKDALMYPNAYLKVYMDESKSVKTETYRGIDATGLVELDQIEGFEFLEASSRIEDTELGQIEVFDVKGKRVETRPKLCIDAVEPEKLRIDNEWTSLSLDGCPFICHEEKRSKTWLIQNGYDKKRLEELGCGDGSKKDWGSESVNRLFYSDENTGEDDAPGMEQFWVREIIAMVDFDGDGIAEQRKIVLIHDEIFENEEYYEQPYVSLVTMLNSHRHVGYSLAESVKDLQRLSSQLIRQILDNAYRLNIQRKYVGSGALVPGGTTLDALEDVNNEIIPVRDPSQIIDEQPNSVIQQLIPLTQSLNDTKKVRTGISPELSLDPEILRGSTAGAFMNALENASQRIEMITRLMAETGIKWMMLKIHRLLREYMDIPKTIRIRGKWVSVNPGDWPERPNVDVSVGLGFNSREKTVAAIMSLLQVQQQAAVTGMVQNNNVFAALSELVKALGFKSPEQFFTPPDQVPPKGPDPEAQALQAQMQAQMEAVKAQQEAVANDRARVQIEAERHQLQIQKDMAAVEQKQRDLDQKEAQLNLDATKTMADIQQGWAQINQKWADIELKYSTDLNQPGIGQ